MLLTPNIHDLLPANFLLQLQIALAQGLFWVYLIVFVLMVVSLAPTFWLTRWRSRSAQI